MATIGPAERATPASKRSANTSGSEASEQASKTRVKRSTASAHVSPAPATNAAAGKRGSESPETAPAKRTKQAKPPVVTRGGHVATGTSASRRAKSQIKVTDKGERTRALIVDAARIVFERLGYLDCRVTDIVKEAGLSHGAFYTYFPSKREVFQQVSGDVGEMINLAVSHAPEDLPGETFENLLRANARYLEIYRANARILMVGDQISMTDPLLQERRLQSRRRHVNRVARMIVRLQERGVVDRDVDPRPTAGALVAMLASSAYWAEIDPVDYDPEPQAVALTLIFARALGIPTPPRDDALKVIDKHRARVRSSETA